MSKMTDQEWRQSMSRFIGMEVDVEREPKLKGKIVGPSQRYNGSWVVLVDGKNMEIHDTKITQDGKHLSHCP